MKRIRGTGVGYIDEHINLGAESLRRIRAKSLGRRVSKSTEFLVDRMAKPLGLLNRASESAPSVAPAKAIFPAMKKHGSSAGPTSTLNLRAAVRTRCG